MSLPAMDAVRIVALLIGLATLIRSVLRARTQDVSRFPLLNLSRWWLGIRPTGGVVVLGVTAGFASVAAVPLAGISAGAVRLVPMSGMSSGWVLLAVVSVLLKATFVLFEEVIYRGSLCSELRPVLPPALVSLISAAVFAAAHTGRSPLGLVIIFVDGFGFAAAFLISGALWLPLVWHLSKNMTVWLFYGLGTIQLVPGPLYPEYATTGWLIGSPNGPGAADLLASILVVVFVLAYLRTRGTPPAAS